MSTPVSFLLPRSLYTEMLQQAQAELPNECCGVLAGIFAADTCRIERRYPLVNEADTPETEYHCEGKSLFAVSKDVRKRQLDIVGFYHSHPTSAPLPSKKDRERNWWGDEVVHFIISLNGDTPEMRGWHLTCDKHWEAVWELTEE